MPSKPNLIYIFADQLRRDACGYAGSPWQLTPNIDAFAARSVDMCNAVSGHPVCAPYRASLFTGKYTTSTGMVINEIRLNPNQRCIAHVLGDAGYERSYIGKWHLYANQLGHHEETRNSFVPPGPDRLGFDGFFAHYGFHHEYYAPHAYYHLDTPEKIFHQGYEPDCVTDMAIAQLEHLSAGDRPFALFLSIGTPHDPWNRENVKPDAWERVKDLPFRLPENYAPENDPHADNWARLSPEEREQLPEWMRGYYGMVANLDDNIGRLMAAIRRLGLEDNSIVVFTSDHGECFGAHGREHLLRGGRARALPYGRARAAPGHAERCVPEYRGHHAHPAGYAASARPDLLRGHQPGLLPGWPPHHRGWQPDDVLRPHCRLGGWPRMARLAHQALYLCGVSRGRPGAPVR